MFNAFGLSASCLFFAIRFGWLGPFLFYLSRLGTILLISVSNLSVLLIEIRRVGTNSSFVQDLSQSHFIVKPKWTSFTVFSFAVDAPIDNLAATLAIVLACSWRWHLELIELLLHRC